jgi:glycosyltransferase involved in cell wall biosynthesis
MPLVSVLMPMHNAEPFVRAAVESVLSQKDVDLELIIIDDHSKDRSGDVARSIQDPRIRVLEGPGKGISAALNMAINAASGDIITRCDADDLFTEGRLAFQVRWLEEHPEFGAICGVFSSMTPNGKHMNDLGGDTAGDITDELRSGHVRTSLCTFAIRAPLLRETGGLRPYFVTAEDIDLVLRLGEITRVWFEPRSVYRYRLHGTSITHNQGKTLRRFYEATAKEFAAQRRAGYRDALDRQCPPDPPAIVDAPGEFTGHIQNLLIGEAWKEHTAGNKWKALKIGWRAVWARPKRLRVWRSFIMLAVKRCPRLGA